MKTGSTPRVMIQGNLTSTEKEYDLAIRGEGFFRIRLPDGRTGYTRDGSFELDAQGQIVTRDGYLVEPAITVPQTAKGVTISAQGQVQASSPARRSRRFSARSSSPASSTRPASNRWATTCSSRRRRRARPSTAPRARKGSATCSRPISKRRNVNAVTEISSLIAAQRAYEMNSKVITAADQMLSSTTNMFRG